MSELLIYRNVEEPLNIISFPRIVALIPVGRIGRMGNVEITGAELEIDPPPIIFFRDIVNSEFYAVIPGVAQVFVAFDDFRDGSVRSSDDRGARERRPGGSQINDFLRVQIPDQIMLINLVPIEIGRETVGPSPPAMLRVGGSRVPDAADVITIRLLRLEFRVTQRLANDGNTGHPSAIASVP